MLIVIKPGTSGFQKLDLLSEDEYLEFYAQQPEQYNMPADDPDKFVAGMGAEAIYELLKEIDIDALARLKKLEREKQMLNVRTRMLYEFQEFNNINDIWTG